MGERLNFQHIGLYGYSVGQVYMTDDGIEWRDRSNLVKSFDKENISHGNWTIFGTKGYLKLYMNDGKVIRLDGFSKGDKDKIIEFADSIGILVEPEEVACDGSNFGEVKFDDKKVMMKAPSGKPTFEIRVDSVANCMLADKNKNEVEIQFHETDTGARDEDTLVQIRFHFPSIGEEEEDDEGLSLAETFQANIEKGMTRSVTGHIIVEFDSELGTFITPRGRYAIQMYGDFLRMHGAKYDYKIQYSDIGKLFLLPKPDSANKERPEDQHNALVICLEKPIRQGNQRYQHLVLQASMAEHTIAVNLSAEELASQYEGQLSSEMTLPLSNLFAKIFKIISGSKVFVPKNFLSDRRTHCVRCSLKANEGLLYPLEKSFAFIHKPTLLVNFDDIDSVEFQRYKATGTSATRNFDLVVILKQQAVTADGKEFNFSGIDRTEYNPLFQFLSNKKLKIKNIEESSEATATLLDRLGEELGGDDGDEDGSEEDSDFEADKSDDEDESGSGSGSGSGSDGEGGGGDSEGERQRALVKEKPRKEKPQPKPVEKSPKTKAKTPATQSSSASKGQGQSESSGLKILIKKEKVKTEPGVTQDGSDEERDEDDGEEAVETKGRAGEKRKKAKKDKNAPKKGRAAYIFYMEDTRASLKEKSPDLSFGEMSKVVSEMWKAVDPAVKAKYEAMAKKDKERYEREMRDYVPPEQEDDDDGDHKVKKKAKKDKNAPKGALTAFFIYKNEHTKEIKEKNPEASWGDLAKLTAAKWKTLTAEEKAVYEEKSKQDKARHSEEMRAYAATKSQQRTAEPDEKMDVEDEDGEDDADDDADEDD